MNNDFIKMHSDFLTRHLKLSTGNRLTRLQAENGHGHAEKTFMRTVWWPVFNHFEGLEPEYELRDFKDGVRYLDFAYISGNVKLAIEIDGYGPHWRDISRWQFADNLMRQNYLIIDGWKVLRFSYDDIVEKPRRCQQMIQQFFGRWLVKYSIVQFQELNSLDREILNFSTTEDKVNAPFIANLFGISTRQARNSLKRLLNAQLLVPVKENKERIHYYRLNPKYSGKLFDHIR